MGTYLEDHPPRIRQFRSRSRRPTGCIVVHTAESAPDERGPDDGAENVARFIRDRTTPGSYHRLSDSDSRIPLIPFQLAAYGDGTGSNEFAIHLSAATQAHRWSTLDPAWVDGCVRNMARDAADAARWLQEQYGITVPARRISRAQSEAGMAGFISHGERDPGRRSDPGHDFPWDRFLAYYAAEMGEDDMADPKTQETLGTILANTERLLEQARTDREADRRNRQEVRGRLKRLAESARRRATKEQADDLADQLEALAEDLTA